MSERQVLQLVTPRRPWYRRALDLLRSIRLGPYDAKDPALARLWGGGPTAAGVTVDEISAHNIAAVWCAVVVIAGGVSALPLDLMRRTGGRNDKERYVDHPTYELMHARPNPEMTSVVFRRTLQSHALIWGNGYAEIERDASARPVALWPLTPDRVSPYRATPRSSLQYRVRNADGTGSVILDQDDMLHIPGLGFDGTCGYSVIEKARESMGLTVATERFGGQFFGNGSSATGVFTHPGRLSDPAFGHLRDSLTEQHAGARNRSPIILEEGMDWKQLTVAPDDGQFLETRKFQIAEIARWFNVPPHKLKDLERATFSNIEQQSIDFVNESLMPWLVCWEQECNRKLIRPLERRQQFFKHNVNALLRGDISSRFNAYAVGRQWGWLSVNDIRDLEDMNPIGPQGDLYLIPQNMVPADKIDQVIDAQTQAARPAPPTAEPDPEAEADRARQAELRAAVDALALRFDQVRAGVTPEQVEALRADLAALGRSLMAADQANDESDAARAARQEEALASLRAAFDAFAPPAPDPALRADMAATLHLVERTSEVAASAVTAVQDLSAAVEHVRAAVTAPPPAPDTSMADAVEAIRAEQAAHAEVLHAILDRLTPETPPEPEPAAEPVEPPPHPRDRARLIAGHRAAVEDAVARLVRRETLKGRRAAKSLDKLRAWIADYYTRQAPAFEAILLPAIQAHLGVVSGDRDPAAVTRELVQAHIDASRAHLHALLDAAPTDLAAEADALFDRWERERPRALADALMEEELAHVGG